MTTSEHETTRFDRAIARFDAENAKDPRTEKDSGENKPKELLYAWRLSTWVRRLDPEASEALLLASRCQHIRRWEIPRSEYPMNKAGYHQWRTRLARFHAETAAGILKDVGYDEETIDRVKDLVRKENLKSDPEVQILEDAICLVFLENELEAFAAKHPDEKVVEILQKAWAKISPRGQQVALKLELSERAKALVGKALGG